MARQPDDPQQGSYVDHDGAHVDNGRGSYVDEHGRHHAPVEAGRYIDANGRHVPIDHLGRYVQAEHGRTDEPEGGD